METLGSRKNNNAPLIYKILINCFTFCGISDRVWFFLYRLLALLSISSQHFRTLRICPEEHLLILCSRIWTRRLYKIVLLCAELWFSKIEWMRMNSCKLFSYLPVLFFITVIMAKLQFSAFLTTSQPSTTKWSQNIYRKIWRTHWLIFIP